MLSLPFYRSISQVSLFTNQCILFKVSIFSFLVLKIFWLNLVFSSHNQQSHMQRINKIYFKSINKCNEISVFSYFLFVCVFLFDIPFFPLLMNYYIDFNFFFVSFCICLWLNRIKEPKNVTHWHQYNKSFDVVYTFTLFCLYFLVLTSLDTIENYFSSGMETRRRTIDSKRSNQVKKYQYENA